MTPADMAVLHRAAFTQSRPWSEAEFTDLLLMPGTFATGDSLSFALVRIVLDEAELLTIATDPAHRRQGLGQEVMRDWQAKAITCGARSAFLEVADDNASAQALYRKCGYQIVGRRKRYYPRATPPNADALIMRRELDA